MAVFSENPAFLSQCENSAAAHPGDPARRFALAEARLACGDTAGGMAALRETLRLNPRHEAAWRRLAEMTRRQGDEAAARAAEVRLSVLAATAPYLRAALAASRNRQTEEAEGQLEAALRVDPDGIAALRLLADVRDARGRHDAAEALLARALALAPDCDATLHHQALQLYRHSRFAAARDALAPLLARDPDHPAYRRLNAQILSQLGQPEAAEAIWRAELAAHPDEATLWRSLGHAQKAAGKVDGAAQSYRRAVACRPDFAEAYWALANLKTVPFTDAERAAMQALTERALPPPAETALRFALGKACEAAGEAGAAFAHYSRGNALARQRHRYRAERTHALCAEIAAAAVPAPVSEIAEGPVPVFIVGLPRSGSTLLEQMLASHPRVEGTMELPDMPALARGLCGPDTPLIGHYGAALAGLTDEAARALGADYLSRTAPQRRLGRPVFLDKRPDNFLHVGLIARALPQAKILDVRRHPMACGWSCFTQLFAEGNAFSYDLGDIGRYYADYAALMDRFDAHLPGRVLHVAYEDVVADPETAIRRMLDFCGLPFEPACLEFHRTVRAVRTASAAEVRRPLNTDGLARWRQFVPWLAPLQGGLEASGG